jgi:hypothetical protein
VHSVWPQRCALLVKGNLNARRRNRVDPFHLEWDLCPVSNRQSRESRLSSGCDTAIAAPSFLSLASVQEGAARSQRAAKTHLSVYGSRVARRSGKKGQISEVSKGLIQNEISEFECSPAQAVGLNRATYRAAKSQVSAGKWPAARRREADGRGVTLKQSLGAVVRRPYTFGWPRRSAKRL